MHVNYGDLHDMTCAIALRDFEVASCMPAPADLTGSPNKHVKVEELDSDDVSSDGLEKETDGNALTPSMCFTSYNGNNYSKHGINFSVCFVKCMLISGVSLSRVAKECVLVAREFKDVMNKDKRFLFRYYYEASVCQFHGKGNRVKLQD